MSNIEFRIYKKDEYQIGQWLGGTTTELGIYPSNAGYKERNFVWRLSSATIETEESKFTSLPDYDRVLIVLKGEVVLAHKEIRVARLAQYEQDRFCGSYETKSYGKITDFNLMVRKGNQGFSEALTLEKDYSLLKIGEFEVYKKMSQCFYCTEGFSVVNFNKESFLIKEGELLVVNCDYGDIKEFGVMGEGKTIWSHVYFNEDEAFNNNQEEHQILKNNIKAKATKEDIKLAALVCFSNFRGGKYLFKGLKDVWYDEALQNGINKLDRIMLPFIISIVGLGFVGFYVWEHFQRELLLPAIMLWLFIDLLIINPLLFLAVLPKPIKSHIKKIADLTEKEKAKYEQQKNENKIADNILKKYKITGRNKYID